MDAITANLQGRMEELILNTATSRMKLLNDALDPRRDIPRECGYPETITVKQYCDLYDRDGVAARVVEIYPSESWQSPPEVYEDEDPDTETPWEQAFHKVCMGLRGPSFARSDDGEGNPLWSKLRQADILAGKGHYGVVWFGFDDVNGVSVNHKDPIEFINRPEDVDKEPLNEEQEAFVQDERPETSRKILFMRCFDQQSAQIVGWDTDPKSPRCGRPTKYLLTLEDPMLSFETTGPGPTQIEVHWSRCIHVVDNWEQATSSENFGVPRMRAVWNYLANLYKVVGGDAEGYWKACVTRLLLSTHPQLGGDVVVNKEDLNQQIYDFDNSLQKTLTLVGMQGQSISPSVVDPSSHKDLQLDLICVKLKCPKRKFMGAAPGQLGGSGDAEQSDVDFNGRLSDRQINHNTLLVCQVIDLWIKVGVLPVPDQGYKVVWPDLNVKSDKVKAEVMGTVMTALGTYVSQGVEAVLPPDRVLEMVPSFTQEEVRQILEEQETLTPEDSFTLPEEISPEDELQMKLDAGVGQPPPFGGKSQSESGEE